MEAGWPLTTTSVAATRPPNTLKSQHGHQRQQQQVVAAAAVALRLYQIASPALAGRAALFGNKLDLKAGWKCLDAPYFSAPGKPGKGGGDEGGG